MSSKKKPHSNPQSDSTIPAAEVSALQQEVAQLKAELETTQKTLAQQVETQTSALSRASLEAQQQRRRLERIIETVPGVVWEAWGHPDESNQQIDFVSSYVEQMLGYTIEDWLATPNFWLHIVHPEDKQRAADESAAIFMSGGSGSVQFRWMKKDGTAIWVEAHSVAIMLKDGTPAGMRGVTFDITARKEAETAARKLQEEIIQMQATALAELSTPLIPVLDKVVIMPLIGAIDSQRSLDIIETLLAGVSEHHAQIAIVDITGVAVVDTQVASGLVRAAQSVRLLGATVILTGIKPEVAQTLVGLGIDLSSIITLGTLQMGILYAMQQHQFKK